MSAEDFARFSYFSDLTENNLTVCISNCHKTFSNMSYCGGNFRAGTQPREKSIIKYIFKIINNFTSPVYALKHLTFIVSFNICASHMPQLRDWISNRSYNEASTKPRSSGNIKHLSLFRASVLVNSVIL